MTNHIFMQSQDLINQLNIAKSIKPDSRWKSDNREILFSQIKSSEMETGSLANFLTWPRKLGQLVSQPAWVGVFILIIAAVFASNHYVQKSMPGDSLYIAKVINEKAQLAITFDQEKKNKLGIKFASDRAKKISNLMANSESDDESTKLAEDFKKEITIVRNKLQEINTSSAVVGQSESEEETIEVEESGDTEVFSANLGKEEKGMQLAEPRSTSSAPKEPEQGVMITTLEIIASSSDEAPSDEIDQTVQEAQKILEEAEDLFANQDYSGTISKLEEVDNLVEGSSESTDMIKEEGEIKGVMEPDNPDEAGVEIEEASTESAL